MSTKLRAAGLTVLAAAAAGAIVALVIRDQIVRHQRDLSYHEIAIARQIYNDTVLTYNNAVETVPSNLVARLAGCAPEGYFEIDAEARSAPEVRF